MKVRYLSISQVPSTTANSIHVLKMAQALAQHGHSVELVCPVQSNVPRFFCHVKKLSETPQIADQYGISSDWAASIQLRHIPTWKPLRMLDYFARATLLGLTCRFVFTRHPLIGSACALLRIPTYLELHSPHLGRLSRSLLQRACGTKALRAVVVISTPLRELLLQAHPLPGLNEKILIEPDAVDLAQFQSPPARVKARSDLGLSTQDTVLGYAGHLYEGRGVERILDIAQAIPTLKVLIAGGTPLDIERVRLLIREREIKNVSLLGFIENAKLPVVLASCDFLAMPYQRQVRVSSGTLDTSAWMSPMKLFEYMAASRVILSSDLPVLREILNEKNSVLLEPEDSSAWISAITRLMSRPLERETLALQAWQDVQRYDWKKRVARIISPLDLGVARTLIFQRVLPHYRIEVFRRLADELRAWLCHSIERRGASVKDSNPTDFPHMRIPRAYFLGKETAVIQPVLRQIFRHRPDTIISEFALGYGTLWLLILLRPIFRFRLLIWTHGVENKTAAGGIAKLEGFRLKTLVRADHLILYSERRMRLLEERFKLHGLKAPRMTVAPNSVPLFEFLSQQYNIQSTHKLAFVGRLIPGKGLELALETYKIISSKMPLEFEIIGDGPLRTTLEREASGLTGVRFHGSIHSEKELAPLLSTCSVFLHPGAIGLSAFHALGSALPIVTCAPTAETGPFHGPEFDLLEHEKNAWICPSNPVALAHGVETLLRNLGPMRERARESVRSLGTLDAMIEGFRKSLTQVRQGDSQSPGNR